MTGLCDCNSFYASCERLFRPDLYHSPIAVLSNNDGVVVALNREAKDLGFSRGDVYAQVRDSMERKRVNVFSSNYALYQNLSDRVMSTLSSLCPSIEQYSIDEAFFTPSGLMDASEIRKKVTYTTGIPVSVTIARTKTLAKAASKIAKSRPGCAFELDPDDEDSVLASLPVSDVWGIGRRYSEILPRLGIRTAKGLRDADMDWISRRFPVTLQRVVFELRGIDAHSEGTNTVTRQSGMTFARPLMDYLAIKNALDIQARYLSEKLTSEGLLAGTFGVSISTDRFKDGFEAPCASVRFMRETAYMPTFSRAVSAVLPRIYSRGREYRGCRCYAYGLIQASGRQLDLFEDRTRSRKEERLQEVICMIDRRYGRNTMAVGGSIGLGKTDLMNQRMRSPAYVTDFGSLPVVR